MTVRKAFLWSFLLFANAWATKHSFYTAHDKRTIIGPVGVPFGFLKRGHYAMNVFDFRLEGKEETLKRVEAGFYLKRFANEAAFNQFLEEIEEDEDKCAFADLRQDDDGFFDNIPDDDKFNSVGEAASAKEGILLSMKNRKKWAPNEAKIDYMFKAGEDGLYVLMYQVCGISKGDAIRSSFELDFHFCNTDTWGNRSFLTAGEMKLPTIFFFFSCSYALCLFVWMTNIVEINVGNQGHFGPSGRGAKVYQIHYVMGALLFFKMLAIFFRALRYHAIRTSGHAEVWTVFSIAFGFVKGIFLFSVILLIGSGWSFVKPFLTSTEKQMVAFILCLQVANQIAIIALSQEAEGERTFHSWTAVLHLVDIICCCAVLLPIVWHVNALERSVSGEIVSDDQVQEDPVEQVKEPEDDMEVGEKGAILSKLKRFRAFYLIVVAYIYCTRILVYLFATVLDYKHLWLRHFVVEAVTLAFYVIVGFMFRPQNEQAQYSSLRKDDDDKMQEIELECKKSAD